MNNEWLILFKTCKNHDHRKSREIDSCNERLCRLSFQRLLDLKQRVCDVLVVFNWHGKLLKTSAYEINWQSISVIKKKIT